jgi:hypothetical protein
VTWGASLGVLLPAAGCSDLFGFQRSSVLVECVQDSDCLGSEICLSNACQPACDTAKDCRTSGFPPGTSVCAAHMCIPASVDAADIVRQDEGAPDSFNGEETGASGSMPDASSEGEPSDAGACTPPCQDFSVCQDATCFDVERYGYVGAGPDTQPIAGNLVGIEIQPDTCGIVTGIGFTDVNATSDPNPEPIRFGLYTETNGQPDRRIAETPESTLQAGTDELLLESPAQLECKDTNSYYWIVGVWPADEEIDFQAEATPVNLMVYAVVATTDELTNGLPDPFPVPPRTYDPPPKQPHVYIIVAQDR